MSGIGKFKLTDALPKNVGNLPDDAGPASLGGKGAGKAKPRNKGGAGKTASGREQSAEQMREARGHVADVSRGNQQSGRQKAK